MGVVVALATASTILLAPAGDAAPQTRAPVAATGLPREVGRGVELTLADGDLFRVWPAKDLRTVWGRRHDAATGTWGERSVVLRIRHLFCGGVDARTANGAVAVIALCDRYGYSDDQAPTHSRAIWSADTVNWSSHRLEGEAYDEPGISPDGTNAVWPERAGYVTRTEAGFARHRLDTAGIEYTSTAVITDTEQVSYLFGAQEGRRCALVVLTRTGDAAPSRQELPDAGGCSDSSFANLDSDTALLGDLSDPAYLSVVSRADAASPWAVTQQAPAYAPGLDEVERGLLSTSFFSSSSLLVALGSQDGTHVTAQVYDPSTGSWGPSAAAYDAGDQACEWNGSWPGVPFEVLVADLRCDGRHVVLTTADGAGWQALRAGRHVYGVSPDGAYVAVPGRSTTSVLSAERGVVTLPLGVDGRCDVVVPDGPDGAVLLTAAGRHRGWPTLLRHSSPTGWQRLSGTRLPVPDGSCRRAEQDFYEPPFGFSVVGQRRGYAVRVVRRGDDWTAQRVRY